MEMLRGALLGLGDTAGDAIASRSHNPNLSPAGTESDVSLILYMSTLHKNIFRRSTDLLGYCIAFDFG